ncbi:integrase [Nakamurella flava]|uniref:Integrase n=1 Tax=Nakamurella flava TaxID=2576308 RepID=A0A4U6QAT4_9ACTN|nr:integrase [Nakamurella flava]TKV56999.1 integrase [Nakamurella flava]
MGGLDQPDPPGRWPPRARRSELVRRTLGGIKRQHGTRPSRRDPLLLTDLRALLGPIGQSFGGWPAGVAARRDAALMLLGFTLAARRSELTTLTLGDLTLHGDDGLHVLLRRSKTDQEGRGQVKAAPRGRNLATCTPCAVTRWVQLVHAADTATPTPDGRDGQRLALMPVLRRQIRPVPGDGHVCRDPLPTPADPTAPVFRVVHRTGRLYPRAMGGDAVNQVIARRAAAAGWPPEKIALLGGHSLRSGFITEGFRAGGDPAAIMRQTGHRNPAQLETYRREHSPLVGNIVQQLDL